MAGSAVVTAGGSRVGKALCLEMMSRGYKIIVSDSVLEKAEMTAREINEQGGSAIAVCCDAADESQVRDLVDASILAYDVPDLVFCNIGNAIPIPDSFTSTRNSIMELSSSDVLSMWNVAARFAEGAVDADTSTRIVFTVPDYHIEFPCSDSLIYGAIKNATLSMAVSMEKELFDCPVDISILCVDQTPLDIGERSGRYKGQTKSISTMIEGVMRSCIDEIERGDFYIDTRPHISKVLTRQFNT